MTTSHRYWAAAACAAAWMFNAPAPVHAQTQRSGGGEVQKFMQQYQQVAAEKTALQAQPPPNGASGYPSAAVTVRGS